MLPFQTCFEFDGDPGRCARGRLGGLVRMVEKVMKCGDERCPENYMKMDGWEGCSLQGGAPGFFPRQVFDSGSEVVWLPLVRFQPWSLWL